MTMTLVRSGHIAHARAMINEEFFLAWGDFPVNYADPWTSAPPPATTTLHTETRTKGAANTSDNLTKVGVTDIVSIKDANQVVYTKGVDFYLDANKVNWSLASVGTKEPAVGVTYTVTYRYVNDDINALLQELGRRKTSEKSYVIEDVNGDIDYNGVKFKRVAYPTPHVFLSFRFENTEATNTSICQVALFIGTTLVAGLPIGQMYFLPNQLADPGSCYLLENHEPFPRNTGKREIFEFVITF